MASFTNRGTKKKPSWQFTISHMVNGKSKPIRKGGFKKKEEAIVAAAEAEAELRKGVVPNLSEVPLSDYFESWIKTFKTGVVDNTLARYKTTLKTVQDHFADKPIQKITKRDYQAFLNDYGKTHAKASTRKLNTHIRACVREAVDEGLIRSDFTRGAVLTGEAEKRPEDKHLDFKESELLLKELYRLIDQSDNLMNYLLLLGLTSGMRFAEIVGLTRKDFDFKTNKININKTWGYTKKMHEGYGPTKNEQSVRKIKMDDKTMKAFEDFFNKTPENIHKLVFYSPSSKYKVLSNGGANKALESILDSIGIKGTICVHGLRHTHASVSLYKGASIYYVSERLGHGDIETTMKYYAHIVKELRERDEEIVVNLFSEMAV